MLKEPQKIRISFRKQTKKIEPGCEIVAPAGSLERQVLKKC